MNFWRIVPGRKEVRSTTLGKFIHEDYIAIGWNPVRDLTDVSEDDLETVCRRDLQGWDEDQIAAAIRAFRLFRYRMDLDDYIVVSADGFIYAIGQIKSPYYKEEEPSDMPEEIWNLGFWSHYHRRKVKWIRVMKIPFTDLPDNVRTKLGLPPVIVRLSVDEWLALMSALLQKT